MDTQTQNQVLMLRLQGLHVQNGAQQIDGQGPDGLADLLGEVSFPSRVLQHFACDCVERALLGEREAGREPAHQLWEVVMVKRLWLDGDASDDALLDAQINAQVSAWKQNRKRYREEDAIQQQIAEKLTEAVQLLTETQRHWQLQAIRAATEAIAWQACENAPQATPLFWLGASEQALFTHWIQGWNQERIWQKEQLLQHLHGRAAEDMTTFPMLQAV